MFYLIVTTIGFYISLSREAAEARCKRIGAKPSDMINCPDFKDVENCLASVSGGYEDVELLIDQLTYWRPLRCRALVDLKAGRTYFCYSNGSVHLELQDGTKFDYKICHGKLLTDKKSVIGFRKLKILKFYDFEYRKTVSLDLTR